jgi:hypothetical protein
MTIIGPPAVVPKAVHITNYSERNATAIGAKLKPTEGANGDVQIQLEVTTVGEKATKIEIIVNGIRIANNEIPVTYKEPQEVPFCFIVPQGTEWEIKTNAGVKEAFHNEALLSLK